MRAIENYKKLAAFKEEVTEALAYTYEFGFNGCKAKVVDLFSSLDLSKIIL